MTKDGYKLTWSDEFNGGEVDRKVWGNELGYIRNHELQYYTDSEDNARLEDGCLIIEGRKEEKSGFDYTSASLNTLGTKSFLYGYVEMRAILPKGKGMWPAFWMMGDNINEVNWPKCGELDIMELIGGGKDMDDKVYGTLHWNDEKKGHDSSGGSYTLPSGVFNDAFHVFGVRWTAAELDWYVDGVVYYTLDISDAKFDALRRPMYILVNLAIGGDWPGSPDDSSVFPNQYIIDYIRVYQKEN